MLLAANNIVKVVLYRRTLPLRASGLLAVCTVVGTYIGARALVNVSEDIVTVAVIVSFAVALAVELAPERPRLVWREGLAPALAVASGATSGFSGTSGPLKGVAVRSLGLERVHTVGAVAIVSTVGDLTKTAVFADAGLLGADSFRITLVVVPLMLAASVAGRWFNSVGGERVYARLFWLVMAGYTGRLLFG